MKLEDIKTILSFALWYCGFKKKSFPKFCILFEGRYKVVPVKI